MGMFFISCPSNKDDNEFYLRGKIISNYPNWLDPHGIMTTQNISLWTDWQSEQGKALHDYVPNDVIADDYNGKFRLLVSGQNIILLFNDPVGTAITILFNWIAETKTTSNIINISQKDIDHKFEYDCYAKTNLHEGEKSSNKAHVSMTRLSNKNEIPNKLNYKLEIAGNTVISIELINGIITEKATVPKAHSWFPSNVEFIYWNDTNIQLCLWYTGENKNILLWYPFGMNLNSNVLKSVLSCYEGISLKEINDAEKEISFNLLDATQSGFADFFTLKIFDNKTASITYYKYNEVNSPVKVRTDNNLECVY